MKNVFKYIMGAALVLGMAACDLQKNPISDFSELTISSQDTTGQTVKYKDRASMYAVYENLYKTMIDRQEHWFCDYLLYGESRTDNAYAGTTGAEVEPVETNTLDASISGIKRDWDRYLEDIAKANVIIFNIDSVPDPAFDKAERAQWKAEAKIFRALMLFDFAHFFGNVPLFLEEAPGITSENVAEVYPLYFPKAHTQKEAYEQCITDLKEALKYAPDLNKGDKTRLSKTVARALLAKLYAEAPVCNWDSCRTYCQAVEDDGIKLTANYSDLFGFDTELGDATMRNTSEAILEIHYFSGAGNWCTWMFGRNLSNWDESFSWAKWITPSENLINDFLAEGDEIRLNETVVYYDCSWSNYYPADHYPFMYKCRSGYNSIIKLRGADILLLKAEAYAHLDRPDDAVKCVNEVRHRVNLPDLTSDKYASTEALLDAILHERRLELALEGQRLFDLIRFEKLEEVMNNLKDPRRLPLARQFTKDHYLLPIPQSAIDQNNNLVQNPGY